jgi:low temperature requirement protein LtrA
MAEVVSGPAQRQQPVPRALFKQPRALQWFEGRDLQKAKEGERQAGRFELFLDLLYVAILANFAETLADSPNGPTLVKYLLIITPAWHIWGDLRELMNSYYTDDLSQRILILWVMCLLVFYGNNAPLIEDIGAMRVAVGTYMIARISCVTTQLIYSFADYKHRYQQRLYFVFTLCGLLLFIPLFFESVTLRNKVAVAVVAIIIEEILWVLTYSPFLKKRLMLRFSTAVDISHEIDRFAALYIIVLGEFLYSIVVHSPDAIGFNQGALRAIWTLIIAFCLNWLYLHGDGAVTSTHPIRRSVFTAFAWILLHLPLMAGLLAGGHVAAASAGTEEISTGERWVLCGGLAIGVAVLWLLTTIFKSHDEQDLTLLPKVSTLTRIN